MHRLFHAGGILGDATIPNQALASARQVVAPKLSSLRASDLSLACSPVSQAVLFSSLASLLGSPGQANYSAANAQLDATSSRWQQQGQCAVSMQWGAWAGGGMASGATLERLERSGLGAVQPAVGLRALAGTLTSHEQQAVVAVNPFRWDAMLAPMA